MATRQEAADAIARYLGTSGDPKRIFADAGDGRWLVLGTQNLAVDKDGAVKAPSEVFSAREVSHLWRMFQR